MTAPRARGRQTSPEHWQLVQDILGAAIECDAAGRSRLLEERCGADADLRSEVESLLAAHDDDEGPLDRLAEAVEPATSLARVQPIGWRGSRIGQYLVLDQLGEGGMGLVYKARDERLERYVALKFLSPHVSVQPGAKHRFLVEARAAAALDHPNVCTIHEIGETREGHLFLAMPLYEGETLEARLRRGRLQFDEAAVVFLQIARALARAHQEGIVHRDVKPSNVMLLADRMAKVLDFGIATRDGLTDQGAPVGTVAYMSPEQLRGDSVDGRADVWALGIVLHEMLTGVRPFDAADQQTVVRNILAGEPALVATSHPDVPAEIDTILRRALAKHAEQRYRSMQAFAAAVAAVSNDERSNGSALNDATVPAPQSPPAGERRRVAVLVSIVSDYGALVEQLDPAATHRVLAQVRDLAVDTVRRHGGLVNQAIGEEIVSVFGVPTAHEDDELRAVRAALELHARVRSLASDAGGATVRVQSGLHVGPVVVQRLNEGPRRYTLVGPAAHVAARLAAHADADDLVLSPECQRLVAPFVLTVSCVAVLLEPGGEAMTPFRVTGETGLETRLEASQREGLTPYVGREADLTRLEACAARARESHGSVVTVIADAGAGKSRLLYELFERLRATTGVQLLQARCRAYGDVEPFFPFVEILRAVVGTRAATAGDSKAIVARIRAMDASLEPFIPLYLHLLSAPTESHPLPRHLQGEHLQAALLDALSAIVTAMARRSTVVVLLEDWHWADAASSSALRRMAEIVCTHRLLFVVSARPERSILDTWPADSSRLSLEPLDFAASAAIMCSVLGVARVPDHLSHRVFERTGGNPFFLEQVCRALIEQGAVTVLDDEAVVDGGASALSLPDTVQAVIRTRLDNLDSGAGDVLRVAAVIGRDFEYALLAEATGASVDLVAAIARLRAAGLIQESDVAGGDSYRFTHALAQEVSYDSLVGHQRKSLHGVIGRAIERQDAGHLDERAALLAHHFERAAAWPEAVRYGQRASERASSLSQFAEALAMLDRVLEWLEHLPDDRARHAIKADLLLRQERACETLGLRGRQRTIIGALIAHLSPGGPSARLAQAYLRQGDLLTLLKRFEAADRALSTALRVSREQGDAALERHTLRSIGLLRWHEGRHADARSLIENALAIDRDQGDLLSVAGDLTNLGSILKSMGQYQAARATLEEALAMPPLAEDPRKMVFALHGLANVHRALNDPDEALVCLRRADDLCRTHLLPIQRSFHLTSIAHIDLQQGRIDQALRTYREAIALSRRARHAEGLAQSLRPLGEVLFGLGMHDEALPYLQEAASLFAQLEDPAAEAEACGRAATILTAAHRSEEARAAWTRVRALREQLGDMTGQLDALEGLAQAMRQQSPADCIPIFEAALALASTLADGQRALPLRNVLGILEWTRGRYAEALAHYEAALLLVRELGDRQKEGLILNSMGVTLTRLHRREEARTVLDTSVALTRETGQRDLEAHALAALGQLWRRDARPERAVECFARSLELRQALGDRIGEGWMLQRVAEARSALGDEAAAREAAAAAARIAVDSQDAGLLAACAPSAELRS